MGSESWALGVGRRCSGRWAFGVGHVAECVQLDRRSLGLTALGQWDDVPVAGANDIDLPCGTSHTAETTSATTATAAAAKNLERRGRLSARPPPVRSSYARFFMQVIQDGCQAFDVSYPSPVSELNCRAPGQPFEIGRKLRSGRHDRSFDQHGNDPACCARGRCLFRDG